MIAAQLLSASANLSPQAVFLALLPKLQKHAKIRFRSIYCADHRADKIAETVALAWKWHLRLLERGRDVRQFPMTFVYLVVAAVKSRRRLTGIEKVNEAMSPWAQHRHGYVIEKLPDFDTLTSISLADALADNAVTPPPDAAAFRVDFPRWLDSLPDRDRRLAEQLMIGEQTKSAARSFRMSPARVSQLRRELREDWARFHEETVAEIA